MHLCWKIVELMEILGGSRFGVVLEYVRLWLAALCEQTFAVVNMAGSHRQTCHIEVWKGCRLLRREEVLMGK